MAARLDARHGCDTRGCTRSHHANGLCHTCYVADRRARGKTERALTEAQQQLRHDNAIKRIVAVAKQLSIDGHPLARELWEARNDLR